jgi:cell wall-associated NlpC family hydrolase
MTFKAYDYGIYFTNSSNTFVYSNKTLGEIVIDCCQRAGVAYDVIAQTDYKVQNITKPRAKYWDVIQSAMQITKRQTGKSYFIQFSDNACHLFERKDCLLQWVIATGENLLKYDYSNSIQQTKTRVKLIDSAQKVVVMKNDAELEACIGTFQDVQQPDDGNTKADLERCAERLLDAQKIPQRTLSLTALGITEAISGYCVYVIIDRLNWGKSFFIDEDTHTFKGNYHEMNLKIKLCGDEISTSVSGILSDYKVEKSTSSTSSESSQLIDLARQQIGKPYVYGASGPNSFDCSGFVCYCYKHTSKPGIGRPNAQGLYGMCKIVSSPQSGDLVFFSDSGSVQRITHVGLYIGNSQMIAAEGTQVQLVSNPSARSSFVGYGRFK